MAKAATKIRPAASAPAKTVRAPTIPVWIWLLLGALAVAALVFAPALNGTFVFDDFHLPFADPHAPRTSPAFWLGGVRPVLMLTYWLNFLISGTQTFGYHVVNLVLHAANAVLIFFIYDRLFAISGATFNPRWFALFGAALFLVHPLQTEPVDYIAGRSELVSGFFLAAAWLVFLRHFEKRTSAGLAIGICLLTALGILSKESAISLPALLLLTDFYFADVPIGTQIRRRFKLYALIPFGGLAAAVLILRNLTGVSGAGFFAGISPFQYALTQCRSILIYLRLFFLPGGQNADWQLRLYRSLTDGAAAAYALGLLLLIALIVWFYKRERLISFGLAAFLVMLAPTSSIVPIRDAVAERRMYLPIAGLILALLGAVSKIRLAPAWRRTAAVAVLALCAVLSWQRSQVWASDFNLWSDALRGNPSNVRAHFGLGSAMMLRGDCAGAVGEFSAARTDAESAAAEVSSAGVLWNLAEAYQCEKKPADALVLYRSFAALQPTAAAFDKIGFAEATLGHSEAALDAFQKALQLDSLDPAAWAYRGMARIALGDRQGEADLHRALELDPGNQAAAEGLARLAAER